MGLVCFWVLNRYLFSIISKHVSHPALPCPGCWAGHCQMSAPNRLLAPENFWLGRTLTRTNQPIIFSGNVRYSSRPRTVPFVTTKRGALMSAMAHLLAPEILAGPSNSSSNQPVSQPCVENQNEYTKACK